MKCYAAVLKSLVVISALLCGAAVAAQGPARALVTDIQGQATAGQRPLSPFSVCYDGDTIEVAKGGRLTLVLTQPLYEFVVTGPAKLRLTGEGLTQISGQAPKQRDLFPGRHLQLQDGLIEQASTRTRGDSRKTAFSQLSPNGSLAAASPIFRWVSPEVTGPVSFTLFDAEAKPLYTQARVDSGLHLPQTLQLAARKHYTWVITGRRLDGLKTRAQGNFIVADATQLAWRQQLGDCVPPAARQVACALLLEQAGFRSDAKRTWQSLSQSYHDLSLVRAHQTLVP